MDTKTSHDTTVELTINDDPTAKILPKLILKTLTPKSREDSSPPPRAHRRGSTERRNIELAVGKKEEIFIEHHSKLCVCCGPSDHHFRHTLHEFVESKRIQKLLLLLLLVDVVVVGLEIAVKFRIISAGPDLTMSSLYLPKEYICASPSEVEKKWGYPIGHWEPGTLQDCCIDFNLKYPVTDIWKTKTTGNNTNNMIECMSRTLWIDSSNASAATPATHRELNRLIQERKAVHQHQQKMRSKPFFSRMLLSATSTEIHHYEEQLERCYDYPNHKYRPLQAHLPFETAM